MASKDGVIAVVPAAGIGRRMGSQIPKQYLPLVGATVIEHTLDALLSCAVIDGIVVGVAEHDKIWPTLAIATHSKVMTVIGGADRAATVTNCLRYCSDASAGSWIMVHDAVRPCISTDDITALWQALKKPCGWWLVGDTVGGHSKADWRWRRYCRFNAGSQQALGCTNAANVSTG